MLRPGLPSECVAMFGLFKAKPAAPAGPYDFIMSVTIDRPASDVYALIDWADLRNSKRQLGNKVAAIDGCADGYRLVMTDMPDLRFDMVVSEAVPGRRYSFSTDIVPKVGRLVESREDYAIQPLGDDQCELTLTATALFRDDMSMANLEEEMLRVNISCHNAVQKLKIHAEDGTEAVKAANRRAIV